jgi:hypothetical protein
LSGANWSFGGVAVFKKSWAALFFAPLRAIKAVGGGGAGGGCAPMVSGEAPMTLDEDRTVPELLLASTLLPRSDSDDSSEWKNKSELNFTFLT